MSSLTAERLYSLLPAIYRIRDEQQGHPLRALLALMAREFEALEENVDQLYDDQFIETCAEWAAPYIGELIGYRPLHGTTAAVASPRAEVANTIGYRRRKGTAAMLEQLARDVTGWPARAVEFFEQLATTQYMNHVRPHAKATADLRSTAAMLRLGGPFNSVAHTADMRRPEGGSGRYNIPNIGLFLWRLQAFSLTNVPLTPEDESGRKFRFNPLGADLPLFRMPLTETEITHVAEPVNVPDAIDLRLMARAARAAPAGSVSIDDYGAGKSMVLLHPNADPIDVANICVCDLRDVASGWAHEHTVAADKVAIDPHLGRVFLGAGFQAPLFGTFHFGFSRGIGGGEYGRGLAGAAPPLPTLPVPPLQPHLNAISGGGRFVIPDSRTYIETPSFKVDGVAANNEPGLEVVVAAANGKRPLIAAQGPISLDIGERGRLVLEGLVISGGALHLARSADAQPRELVLRHCTLVPGLSLNSDGSATSPAEPSLIVAHPFATVTLEQCIVGALQIVADAEVNLIDCIVDAGSSPEAFAFESVTRGLAGAEMTIRDSTVIGMVRTKLMRLASNTLFLSSVLVERKQEGCMRFCYVPSGSLAPKRFRCVPDERDADLVPRFTSLRYGDPGYAQLRSTTAKAIREGADDEGEIGVMHALHQPQREANLRIRLDEYLRFGLHAGIFYAT